MISGYALMDTLATEIRISGRVLEETLGGLRRTGWMNLVIIITMASILSIFGILSAFVLETQLFVNNIGSALKISVYTTPQVSGAMLMEQVKTMPHVAAVTVIPKDQAWETMKEQYQVPDIPNPLPDTLHVQVDDQANIEPLVAKFRQLPGVETINYAQSVLRKLRALAHITSIAGVAVTLFLGTLTLFIISNTIHLLIEGRSREIEILRMMGVGNWYIRLPFLMQGAFYGLMGALIAYIPLSVSEYYLGQLFQYFQFSTSGYSYAYVFLVMVLMGIFVGGVGAAVSVHRYLKI